ncbi:MAG: hypothetical protein ABH887_00205 [bacterium]
MRIKATRKVYKKTKYSYAVTLSPKMMKNMGWREGQKLVVIASQKTGKITIEDWKEEK